MDKTVMRILEHKEKAEHLCTTHTKRDLINSKKSGYILTTLPVPQAGAALCQEVPPEPYDTSSGKESPGKHPVSIQCCGSLCRNLCSDLAPQRFQENLQRSFTGNLTLTEKRGWVMLATIALGSWQLEFLPAESK